MLQDGPLILWEGPMPGPGYTLQCVNFEAMLIEHSLRPDSYFSLDIGISLFSDPETRVELKKESKDKGDVSGYINANFVRVGVCNMKVISIEK